MYVLSKNIFPKDFLWGVATSSHQIEGGLCNDWSRWEEKRAHILARKGLRPKVASLVEQASDFSNYISNSKYSPESYKYWDKDVEVIKSLGLKAYRLSVEWSRIQPEKDVFSEEGIQYYINIIKELNKNNIKVVLTCWHWSLPVWLEEEGGLMSKDIFKYFNKYVEYLYFNMKDYVDYWITVNEPETFIFSYLLGTFPPGKRNPFYFNKVFKRILPRMHIEAYKLIKRYDPNIPVSLAKSFWYISPYNSFFLNKIVAKLVNWYVNDSFLDKVIEYVDFVGLNFYFHKKIGILGERLGDVKVSDLGWGLEPEKLYDVIKYVEDRYGKPIFITENGLADSEDKYREWWIKESVLAISRAMLSGSDVLGYLHWSLLDNFEWDKGYWPKFGLCSIDVDSKERIVRNSGYFYSKIVRNNGIIE